MYSGTRAACGALGDYDPARLERMRAALGGELAEVHRDAESLALVRGPSIRWSAERSAGVAWPEGLASEAAPVGSWQEAARLHGACGIVAQDGRRLVHASVSGAGPVYHLESGDATYFCSRIEPLVAAAGKPLRADWSAWSEILTLGTLLGDRTPFEEVRRLPPFSTLAHRPGGRAEVTSFEWPWAEPEEADPDAPALIAAALRESVAAIPVDAPVICPLSGGWDSRLLLCLLAERGADVTACTISADNGRDREQRYAAAVAGALGVPHVVVEPGQASFARDFAETGMLTEHQCAFHIPLTRLARHLRATPGRPVVDGLGGDYLIKGLYVTPQMVAAEGWDEAIGLMWDGFSPERPEQMPLRESAWATIATEARASLAREAERFRDHPNGLPLSLLWTRDRRAISLAPLNVLGAENPVAMPFIDDRVVRAAFAARPRDRLDGGLYRRVFAEVNPSVGALPSTNDPEPEPGESSRNLPRIEHSREARRWYLDQLATSPLRPLLSPELTELVERDAPGRIRPFLGSQALVTLRAIAHFGLWWRAYEDALLPLDISELAD